jgi:hypothetical protein
MRHGQPTRDAKRFKSNEAAGKYLENNGFVMDRECIAFPWHNTKTGKFAARALDSRGRYCVFYRTDLA